MMCDRISELFEEIEKISNYLQENEEPSYKISFGGMSAKFFTLCIASYFESELKQIVETFIYDVSKNELIVSFVKNKGIERQYHAWFDWDKRNANKFFSLFGERFKTFMKQKIDEGNSQIKKGMEDFLAIGQSRNNLTHNDIHSFPFNDTISESYERYKNSLLFIKCVKDSLYECAQSLSDDV
ncbi:MAG: hypothetical protein LWY06_04330 [Firmicutes bacterium]|nr:hypothetical protein [Bacillota bacterium]